MKIGKWCLAVGLALTITSCGADKSSNKDGSSEAPKTKKPVENISAELQERLDEDAKSMPQNVIGRVPVVDNKPQYDKVEYRSVENSVKDLDEKALSEAYDNGTPIDVTAVSTNDNLDEDTSAQSCGLFRRCHRRHSCCRSRCVSCCYRPPVIRSCGFRVCHHRPMVAVAQPVMVARPVAVARPIPVARGFQYSGFQQSSSWFSGGGGAMFGGYGAGYPGWGGGMGMQGGGARWGGGMGYGGGMGGGVVGSISL